MVAAAMLSLGVDLAFVSLANLRPSQMEDRMTLQIAIEQGNTCACACLQVGNDEAIAAHANCAQV